MTMVGQLMTNLKMTVRADCAVSAYSPLPAISKSSSTLIVVLRGRSVEKSALGWTSALPTPTLGCLYPK